MARKQPGIFAPNFLDTTFTGGGIDIVAIGGGDWLDTRPLTNLQDILYKNTARSAGILTTEATFDVDLGAGRDVKLSFIPNHNISNSGTRRIQASNTIAWLGVVVDGNQSAGDTTLDIDESGATLQVGQIFSIPQVDDTVYVIDVVAAGTVTIRRSNIAGTGLNANVSGSNALVCHSGDFSAGPSLLDTGFESVVPVTHPYATLEYGHPSFFDGKPSAEERQRKKLPDIHVETETLLARYWRYTYDDVNNADGFISFPRLYLMRGWLPTKGVKLNPRLSRESNSTRKTAKGGGDFTTRNPNRRRWELIIQNLPADEAVGRFFDIQDENDIDLQMVYIPDINDLSLAFETAFACTFENLGLMNFPFLELTDIVLDLREVTA